MALHIKKPDPFLFTFYSRIPFSLGAKIKIKTLVVRVEHFPCYDFPGGNGKDCQIPSRENWGKIGKFCRVRCKSIAIFFKILTQKLPTLFP